MADVDVDATAADSDPPFSPEPVVDTSVDPLDCLADASHAPTEAGEPVTAIPTLKKSDEGLPVANTEANVAASPVASEGAIRSDAHHSEDPDADGHKGSVSENEVFEERAQDTSMAPELTPVTDKCGDAVEESTAQTLPTEEHQRQFSEKEEYSDNDSRGLNSIRSDKRRYSPVRRKITSRVDCGKIRKRNSEYKPKVIYSIENFEGTHLVNSPRTLEACEREGITPSMLLYRTVDSFEQPGLPEVCVRLWYESAETRRREYVHDIQMERQKVIDGAMREELGAKDDSVQQKNQSGSIQAEFVRLQKKKQKALTEYERSVKLQQLKAETEARMEAKRQQQLANERRLRRERAEKAAELAEKKRRMKLMQEKQQQKRDEVNRLISRKRAEKEASRKHLEEERRIMIAREAEEREEKIRLKQAERARRLEEALKQKKELVETALERAEAKTKAMKHRQEREREHRSRELERKRRAMEKKRLYVQQLQEEEEARRDADMMEKERRALERMHQHELERQQKVMEMEQKAEMKKKHIEMLSHKRDQHEQERLKKMEAKRQEVEERQMRLAKEKEENVMELRRIEQMKQDARKECVERQRLEDEKKTKLLKTKQIEEDERLADLMERRHEEGLVRKTKMLIKHQENQELAERQVRRDEYQRKLKLRRIEEKYKKGAAVAIQQQELIDKRKELDRACRMVMETIRDAIDQGRPITPDFMNALSFPGIPNPPGPPSTRGSERGSDLSRAWDRSASISSISRSPSPIRGQSISPSGTDNAGSSSVRVRRPHTSQETREDARLLMGPPKSHTRVNVAYDHNSHPRPQSTPVGKKGHLPKPRGSRKRSLAGRDRVRGMAGGRGFRPGGRVSPLQSVAPPPQRPTPVKPLTSQASMSPSRSFVSISGSWENNTECKGEDKGVPTSVRKHSQPRAILPGDVDLSDLASDARAELDSLRRNLNQALMQVLQEEREKEDRRELGLALCTNTTERLGLEAEYQHERTVARERIKCLIQANDERVRVRLAELRQQHVEHMQRRRKDETIDSNSSTPQTPLVRESSDGEHYKEGSAVQSEVASEVNTGRSLLSVSEPE